MDEVAQETAHYVEDRAVEAAAETGSAESESESPAERVEEAMVRSPAGRLMAAIPLTAIIGEGIRPFRRNAGTEPSPRWVGIFLAVCAVLFIPYIVQLGFQLPSRVRTDHYRESWVGLDAMELLALGATAWFAWRRSTWVAISAAMASALLVADAWFDIATADRMTARVEALLEAAFIELPMAAFCLWIARRAEIVADRATRLLLRRSIRQAERIRELEQH